MKKCFKCNSTKEISEFYKHKMMADGHLNKCKDCAKKDVRQHRKENDSVRQYDRDRYKNNPKRRAKSAINVKKWKEKFPERYKAHYLLSNAVRDKRANKMPCVECGSTENIHAHHEDYNKPLEVIWFCAKHHHRHHAKQ